MIEYPSIINSSKAPRQPCIAFDKLDGSNFRAKYTPKKGFDLFGTRTQLIDESTPFWKEMVEVFKRDLEESLIKIFKGKDYRDFREIVVFGEFLGENSFAGNHEAEPHKIVMFDVMVGHKLRKFVNPKQFVKDFGHLEIPRIVYEGNLNDEFISDVRANKFDTKEGVICKGSQARGDFAGGIWMCKIKTQAYLDKLKEVFQADWQKFGE